MRWRPVTHLDLCQRSAALLHFGAHQRDEKSYLTSRSCVYLVYLHTHLITLCWHTSKPPRCALHHPPQPETLTVHSEHHWTPAPFAVDGMFKFAQVAFLCDRWGFFLEVFYLVFGHRCLAALMLVPHHPLLTPRSAAGPCLHVQFAPLKAHMCHVSAAISFSRQLSQGHSFCLPNTVKTAQKTLWRGTAEGVKEVSPLICQKEECGHAQRRWHSGQGELLRGVSHRRQKLQCYPGLVSDHSQQKWKINMKKKKSSE